MLEDDRPRRPLTTDEIKDRANFMAARRRDDTWRPFLLIAVVGLAYWLGDLNKGQATMLAIIALFFNAVLNHITKLHDHLVKVERGIRGKDSDLLP